MTNAEYIEAIGARCSRRTYSHTPPDPRVLEILQEMVDAVNHQSGLSFRLLADGTAPFTLFTGKFALVAVCGPDTEWARIQSGYFGESIVLQCVYHGLGTCWVTGTYNENKLYQMLDLPRDLRLYPFSWPRLLLMIRRLFKSNTQTATVSPSSRNISLFRISSHLFLFGSPVASSR